MRSEKYEIVPAVIAAHPKHQVVGRTRLQKTIWLLQRTGLPTDYHFTNYHYGPYSEGLQADVGLFELMGILSEQAHESQEGSTYYVVKANEKAQAGLVSNITSEITLIAKADPIVLELAATYDYYRQKGFAHEMALAQLRAKKPEKCTQPRERKALNLLKALGLPHD